MGSQTVGHHWSDLARRQHLLRIVLVPQGFSGGASGKESSCQCRSHKRRGFNPQVRKIPWRRVRPPTPVFLPRESHGQRSLVGYGHRVAKSWTLLTACTHAHTHTHTHNIISTFQMRKLSSREIIDQRSLCRLVGKVGFQFSCALARSVFITSSCFWSED